MARGLRAVAGRANWVEEMGLFDAPIFRGDTVMGNMDSFATTAAHLGGWRCPDSRTLIVEARVAP